MRIVIATGIYPPEPGGPAYYALHLSEALRAQGHKVRVVTYSRLKRLPMGVRHLAYALRLFPRVLGADVVLALDTFSVALPAVLVAPLAGVPVVIRTGGDFLWEQYVERTGDMLPLPRFYAVHRPLTRKERIIFALTRFVLARATIVFSTRFQRDIWIPAYGLAQAKTRIIENAIAKRFEPVAPERKEFLWFTRGIRFKNEAMLREAFAKAKRTVPEIELVTGTVPQGELIERMRRCYAAILPSLSEISPNYVLDAIRCGKPFIQTKYSEFATQYADLGLVCDPLSSDDIAAQIVKLCDRAVYDELSRRIAAFPLERTYAQVADDFVALFRSL